MCKNCKNCKHWKPTGQDRNRYWGECDKHTYIINIEVGSRVVTHLTTYDYTCGTHMEITDASS